ncbi:putative sugar transporter [Xylariomycetidae sp. FL0641]|nr:putative sugar transporter [Xylariomycetidae sp. FL0641]
MGIKRVFTDSTIAKYARAMREAPREVICNKHLLLSAVLYVTSGIPITWDQGSSSLVPSLPGFQVYFGLGTGAGLSFFVNDRIGRPWASRLYMAVWAAGQMVATFAPNLHGLYAARIISGLGLGPLTALGPMALVEIAPTEMRGLLAAWLSAAMLLALCVSTFCVCGAFTRMAAAARLQCQVVWFAPCVFAALCVAASFTPLLVESPRWLVLAGRGGLPADHPPRAGRTRRGARPGRARGDGFVSLHREAVSVPANLCRVQQALLSYALAQLSGANSVTSYSMAKFFFTLVASFFLIDALGRRKSLFVGIVTQMLGDVYIGVYIKFKQEGTAREGASKAAIAAILIHAFGYAVGLLILPYVFGAELWPNRIRSFGATFAQCFHWLFFYGINAGTPSLLTRTNNWGSFPLLRSLIAGLSVEEIDGLFKGSWFNAWKRAKKPPPGFSMFWHRRGD